MSQEITKLSPDIISSIVLNGDISKLNSTQKVQYYNSLCERLGIDPATQPFKILKLNGKEVLYADKGATQQLSKIYKISHEERKTETVNDVYCVTIRAIDSENRFTDEKGAVNITGLKGDSLANAMMKAMTKGKRRAVLALCGLGILDESEIETIPGVQTEVFISNKPQIPMPFSKNDQLIEAKNGGNGDLMNADEKLTNSPLDQSKEALNEEIPIIGKAQYANLRLTAKKNGWLVEDLKKQVTDLGYEYDKEYIPLNALDFEGIEAFFSVLKADYMFKQQELAK